MSNISGGKILWSVIGIILVLLIPVWVPIVLIVMIGGSKKTAGEHDYWDGYD